MYSHFWAGKKIQTLEYCTFMSICNSVEGYLLFALEELLKISL